MIIQLIIAAVAAFIAGLAGGWFLSQRKMRRVIAVLQTELTGNTQQIADLEGNNTKLTMDLSIIRDQVEQTVLANSKLSVRLEESTRKEKEMQQVLEEISRQKESVINELNAGKELQTKMKAKYDDLYIKHIALNNERNRLKEQVEQHRNSR